MSWTLSAVLQLLVLGGLCKLNTLVDVAFEDRYQLINTLLLNSIQFPNATHLLDTTFPKLDLQQ